ncbi:hypothetical protein RchiOBHm_Chr7g0235161 [Rosa chinensis]|uniref:Uncharacterized protein n=1 Tax=Rosa chinensis TaxID=74649 RepID=A0A2P6PGM9_ROSCH|nr:hypothetical protein RchiOBHm_Chr7g0235161 [Rosa chinensis]
MSLPDPHSLSTEFEIPNFLGFQFSISDTIHSRAWLPRLAFQAVRPRRDRHRYHHQWMLLLAASWVLSPATFPPLSPLRPKPPNHGLFQASSGSSLLGRSHCGGDVLSSAPDI